MATKSRRQSASVVKLLESDGHRFEFFQAVRILQRLFDQQDRQSRRRSPRSVGKDTLPQAEPLRFSSALSSSFPSAAIASIDLGPAQSRSTPPHGERRPARMIVNFMGLTGPQGVLPEHFNRLLIDQHRANDDRLADFQDLFNHRMISLFYRAWEKYQFAIRYERARLLGEVGGKDPFTQCLLSLVGMGTRGLDGRSLFNDQILIYYGGHFSARVRHADGLAALLADQVGMPVQIDQFQGQWLTLSQEDRSRLFSARCPPERVAKLGVTATLGTRIWDVQDRFRVVLGPLTYRQFLRLIPDGEGFNSLRELVRCYVGPQFDFDIQPILKADEVPTCRLGRSDDIPRLGRTTFLRSQQFDKDFNRAAFDCGEI